MKHFLVTSWPVIFYLFILHWSVSPPSTAPRCQNRTISTISCQQRDPPSGAEQKTVCARKNNRAQEGQDRRNPPKTRRSALRARVGGASIYTLWVRAFSRPQRKCPGPLEESRGTFQQERSPGLLSFGTFLCRSKGKYTQSRTIRPQQYHYSPQSQALQLNNITINPKHQLSFRRVKFIYFSTRPSNTRSASPAVLSPSAYSRIKTPSSTHSSSCPGK